MGTDCCNGPEGFGVECIPHVPPVSGNSDRCCHRDDCLGLVDCHSDASENETFPQKRGY